MAHTPGPWQVGEDNDVFINGSCIATVCGAPDGIQESVANAHLIAAAPDLLAAVQAILDAQSARKHPLGEPNEGIATQCAAAASFARAAIAKATAQSVANARLIAAAPDLLAALERIVNDSPEPGEDAELTTEGYNQACAAIAKALAQ